MTSINSYPLVSVIIPVFNQKEEYLRQCIESILNQDYPNFELIISDNHSENGSWEVINSYEDSRLKLVRPPQHLPMVQHWAYAGFHAKGEYLSMMGSDDWAEPGWLSEMMAEFISYTTATFSFPNLVLNYQKTGKKHNARNFDIPTQLIPSTKAACQVAEWTSHMFSWWVVGAVIRAKDYFSVCGIARYATIHNGDYPLSLGLLTRGDVLYINRPLVNYRIWGEEDGKSDSKREIIILEDMVKIVTCIKLDPPVLSMLKKSGWSINRIRFRFIKLILVWLSSGLAKNSFSDEEKNRIIDGLSALVSINLIPRLLVVTLLPLIKFFSRHLKYRLFKLAIRKLFFS